MIQSRLLYESLPYIYSFSGITAMTNSAELIGRMSGLLLVSAALLIFHMRLEFRRESMKELQNDLSSLKRELAYLKRGQR